MQFLFFSAQYLPTVGGVERYTHSLAATLAAMGHGATVVTSALPGLPAREVDENGIELFRLPAFLPMNGRFPVPRPGSDFNRLAAELWQKPFGFAVINTRFYPLSVWAAKECAARGIPAIVLEHGTKHLSLESTLLNGVGNFYEHTAMKLVRRWCDDFYGVSKACGDWLTHFHVIAKGTLYNAVDAEAIEAAAGTARPDFRAEAGAAPGAPLIAFIGRFIVEKGVRELLEAFAAFRGRYPGAALVMAGDGPLLPELRAAAPAGVLLPGALPYAESLGLMKQADVFCLPSYSEGFSTTILEAAALAACIVTTCTGGSPELIQNGESGILLDGHDPASIEKALLRCAESPALRAGMGAKARAAVQARFTWQRTAEKLLEIAGVAQR